ncbi:FtsX-like permease family protein [Cryptosporangium arvum]|uniref:FtsX-like permease family protein n=1 Tax=Cryptosporangium arvum TaxID=80871 RepID=UPI0004B39885|nr:FtsX-like permease family protein [Cryptosporangium arvum]
MLRLVVNELRAKARIWLGVTVVAAATAAVLDVAATALETAARAGGNAGLALYAIGGLMVVTTTVAAVVVLSSAAGLTVVLQQRDYALWQLTGIGPSTVRLVVSTQLVVVALIGAVAGTLVALPVVRPLFARVVADSEGLGSVDVVFGPRGYVSVVVFVAVVVLFAGGGSARRAARVNGLAVLRDPDPPTTRMGVVRWVAAALLAALAGTIVRSLPGRPAENLEPPLLLTGLLVASLSACLGPVLYPAVMRAWTSVVPATASSSWFLARAGALHRVGRSSATMSPLVVAVALPGSLYAANGVARSGSVGIAAVVLLIGGPLVLSVLGAAVTVVMASGARDREAALVQASGGTAGVVVGAAAWEAVLYVVTAALVGAVAVGVVTVAGVWAAGAAPAAGFGAVAVTAAGELALMLVATLLPAWWSSRRPIAGLLAAE